MLRRRSLLRSEKKIDYSAANVGDYICSDRSVETPDTIISSGKKPIAVVFFNEGRILKAISRESVTQAAWSPNGGVNGLGYPRTESETRSTDTHGKENTTKIVDNFPTQASAAKYCRDLAYEGTSAGEWNMLSGSEFSLILDNWSLLTSSLNKIGSRYTLRQSEQYWISLQYSASASWYITGRSDGVYDASYTNRINARYILPFIQIEY